MNGSQPSLCQINSHYRILGKAGAAVGWVLYIRPRTPASSRFVALKFLPDELAHMTHRHSSRFRREAKAASALNHPQISAPSTRLANKTASRSLRWNFSTAQTLEAPHFRQAAAAGASAGVGDRDCGRTGCGARQRNRPPRHQARQHFCHRARPRQDIRFWTGKAGTGGRLPRTFRRCPLSAS